MYIANQSFHDEDTLLEVLFDFELGVSSAVLKHFQQKAVEQLQADEEFWEYQKTIEEKEEADALVDDRRLMILAEMLMEKYKGFEVKAARFYGKLEDGEEELAVIELE